MKYTPLITSAAGIALLLASAAPAFAHADTEVNVSGEAETNTEHHSIGDLISGIRLAASTTAHVEERRSGTSTENKIDKKIEKGQQKAGDSIDKRIESLQELSARLAKMKLLPANALATIQASIAAEIKILTELKAQIGNDTSTTTLKAHSQSITKANRVYLLVIPKAQIAAAADRIDALVLQMQALSVKLQARLTAAQTAGADITAASTALADFNVKIADAKVQADAAVALTANLQPDNGDAAIKAANDAALKNARAKLEVARKDLAAARADAAKIYGVVKGKEGKSQGEVHASTSAETH